MAISLANIKTGRKVAPPRIVLYGVEKVGKTTFASQAPEPIFIQTERGRGVMEYPRFTFGENGEREVAASTAEVFEALKALSTEEHKHKTVVLDSATGFERLIFAELCKEYGEDSITSNKKGSPFSFGRGPTLAKPYWERLLSAFDYLNLQRNMAVIVIAHAAVERFASPTSEDYDHYNLSLHKHPTGQLTQWADAILFADFVVALTESKDGSKTLPKSNGSRTLYTQKRPGFVAGNRYGLPFKLPFTEDAGWSNLMSAMSHGTTAPSSGDKKKETKKEAA